jgi:hypothetical protein
MYGLIGRGAGEPHLLHPPCSFQEQHSNRELVPTCYSKRIRTSFRHDQSAPITKSCNSLCQLSSWCHQVLSPHAQALQLELISLVCRPFLTLTTDTSRYDATSNLCSAGLHLEHDVTSSYDGLTYRPPMYLAENAA